MKKVVLSTEPKFIDIKGLYTIEVVLVFPKKVNYYDMYNQSILEYISAKSNESIRDMTEYKKEKLRKLILRTNLSLRNAVDNSFITYSFTLPKTGIIKDFNLEESFKFAIDSLFNPATDNGKMDEKLFKYEKDYFEEKLINSLQGIYRKNNNLLYDIIDPTDETGLSYENKTKALSETTPETTYKYFLDNIKNNNFISYVAGDFDHEEMKRLFKKYLPQKEKEIELDINYFKLLPYQDYTYTEVTNDFNQSQISLEYTIPNLKEKDRIYLSTIYNILNARENNLIFEKLRLENNLIYDSGITGFTDRGFLIITAFISKDNKDKVVSLIKEVIEEMKDKEYLTNCINRLIKGIEVDLLREEDDLLNKLNEKIYLDFKQNTTRLLLEKTKKIDIDKLIYYINSLELTNEVFFKGEGND